MTRNTREKGQSLVLFAIALLGLVAVAALIIDGGSIYVNRRNAQTAADAAALAAAHVKCVEQGNLSAVQNAAYQYAVTQNHATAVDPVITDMNNMLGPVEVHTTVQTPSFFASVLGRPNDTARAASKAACFAPAALGGVLPVTWACGVLIGQPPNQCNMASIPWTLFKTQIVDVPSRKMGLSAGGSQILDQGDGVTYASYVDGIGPQLVYVIYDTSMKAWLSLDGLCKTPPCLRGWMGSPPSGYAGQVVPPVWVPAITGVKKGSLNNWPSPSFLDNPVLVPVINSACEGTSNVAACANYRAGDLIVGSGSGDYYRVAGIAPFIVTCVTKQGNDTCPKAGKGQGSFEGYFVSGIIEGTQINPGGFNLGVYVISLTQ